MNQGLEARIAWVLVNLLEDVMEELWNRYDKQFVDLITEEQKKDIRIGEMVSQMDPDSPCGPEF